MRRTFAFFALALLLASCSDRPSPVAPRFGSPIAQQPETRAIEVESPAAATLGPRSADRVLVDARAAIQRAASLDDALDSWGASLHGVSDVRVRFAGDIDGAGTSAIRIDWEGERRCAERSPSIGVTLPEPYPTRMYIQWKQRLGRTRTGGGLGKIDSFVIPSSRCKELDGRFVWTVGRDASSGRRVDLRWRGEAAPRPELNVKRTDILAPPNQGWVFLPGAHTGEVLVQTLYLQAESRPGAADGAARLWVGDRLLIDRVGLALGAEAFRRMNFPWTMAAPLRGQTEYYWDMVSWVSAVSALTLDALPAAPMSVGDRATLQAQVIDGHGADVSAYVPLTWQSSDDGVARVSARGELVAVGAGDAVITVRAEGSSAEARVRVLHRGLYVAADGTADGDGSWARPWDLPTALSGGGGRIVAGDTIWLRGGVYRGDFTSLLVGTPAQPVVVRQLPGEHATIEGRLRVRGAASLFWGFEVLQADALATNRPALVADVPGTRFVNLIIHDAGENGISFHTPGGVNEIYGCIIYNNGNNEHLDHGIYASNADGEQFITDNVLFNNMASGIQVFRTDARSPVVNARVVGNISFNNSYIAASRDEENITAGGNGITSGLVITDNVLYYAPGGNGHNLRVGLDAEADGSRVNDDAVVRGNYVVGGAKVFQIENWRTAVVEDNTFVVAELPPTLTRIVRMSGATGGYSWRRNTFHVNASAIWSFVYTPNDTTQSLDDWRARTGLGADDQVLVTAPVATRVFVRPNRYERGRAHIAVMNWANEGAVALDVSGILRPGDRYEVHNVQDLASAPVVSGVYDGAPIILPMSGVDPPPAIGRPRSVPRTGPFFDVFLLTLAASNGLR